MSRIFLSHSHKDIDEANALKNWLAFEGWDDVFLDSDPETGIAVGENWLNALTEATDKYKAVIFLISQNWLNSDWCKKEYKDACSLNKKLFPVLIDPSVQSWDNMYQSVELVPAGKGADASKVKFSESGLSKLRRSLKEAGLDASFFLWPPEDDRDRDPYRGFNPLDADDAGIYFGRDARIDQAISVLRSLTTSPPTNRLFVILGASGAGKSSFLRAGLLPRLERDEVRFKTIPPIRPGHAPLTGEDGFIDALAAVLKGHSRIEIEDAVFPERSRVEVEEVVGEEMDPKTVDEGATSKEVDEAVDAIRPLLLELVPPTLVIAIDQAEELFDSQDPEESYRLLTLLAELVKAERPPVIVIFAIRSDSYAKLQKAEALKGLEQTTFSLAAMRRDDYAKVIDGPAGLVKLPHGKRLTIESTLTTKLLDDLEAGAGDALPLLALTLQQLYRNRKRSDPKDPKDETLGLEDYQALGGLKGVVNAAVERAFESADEDFKLPSPRRDRLICRGFIPWLASVDPDTKEPRRNIALRDEIPEDSLPLIDLLAAERLLSADESRIEPTHEALLRQWELLRVSLGDNAAHLTTLEEVRRSAAKWEANGKDKSRLEHRDWRLRDAQALDKSWPDIAARLDKVDRAYLSACAKRESFRSRIFAVVVTGLLGIATLVALLAVQQRTIARRNESVALTRLADAQADSRPIEATKLALAALRETDATMAKETAKFSISMILDKFRGALEALAPSTSVDNLAIFNALGHAVPNLRQLKVFESATRGAEFGPDGKQIVAVRSAGSEVRVLNPNLLDPIPLPDYRGAISATFSDDRRLVLTRSWDAARLWDVTRAPTKNTKLEDSGLKLTAAALSRDGKRAVTASISAEAVSSASPTDHKQPTVLVWDVDASGGEVRVHQGVILGSHPGEEHTDKVNSVAFSRDGTRIVTASDDKTARVWNAGSGKLELTLNLSEAGLYAAFSPDSPDGKRLVTVSDNDAAQVWDSAQGWKARYGRRVGKPMNHKRRINSAVFNPQGTQIVTASDDGTAGVWDASSGAAIATLAGHNGKVKSAAFSPDGAQIVTASDDNTVRIWDIVRGSTYRTLNRHTKVVWSGAFNQDGTRVVTASEDGLALIWDTTTGSLVGKPMQHRGEVTSAGFNIHGDRIVTTSKIDGTQVWDAATGNRKDGFDDAKATYAVFSPDVDGERIATAYEDGTVRIWKAAIGRKIAEGVDPGRNKLWSVEFSQDGNRIVTASDDKTARVWDAVHVRDEKLEQLSILRHEERVFSASFSPDGKQVVTASEDDLAYVWDVSTATVLHTLVGHQHWVNSAAFSAEGKRIVTGSKDGTARVWDAMTGRPIAVLAGHGDGVEFAAFSRDGKSVVTASDDKTARLWDVSTIPGGDIVHVACKLLNGDTALNGMAQDMTFDYPICPGDPAH